VKRRIISMLTTAVILAGMVNVQVFAEEDKYTEIYVSLTGSDQNDGTLESPLLTAKGARDRIRELKNKGLLGEKGAVIYFREGIYQFTESLKLTKEDSGTKDAPIVYKAYNDETVKFIGGVNIKPQMFQKVTDSSVLDRLVSDNAKDSLYRVDLKGIGVEEIPMPYLLGQYSYWQVAGATTDWCINLGDLVEELGYDPESAKSPELFVDGELMNVSKYPNDGYATVDTVTEPGPFMRNWNDDILGSQSWIPPEERIPTPFRFISKDAQSRMEKWQTADQALMWGRFYWEWATQSVPVDYVVPASGEIASKVPSAFSVRTGQPWYIYNLLEEIDEPGEYFLDRNTGYLYIYPKTDISSVKEVLLTLLDDATIHFDGASYIDFKGIDMGMSRRHSVYMKNSDNIHILDSEISYTAGFAVKMERSTNCTVKNSYIHDVDGGVDIIECGDIENLIPGNCGVENCELEWFARLSGTGIGAVNLNGCGNYARNNEIHNAQHLAVTFRGPNHEISFNNIYNVCQESDDAGVIYAGRRLAVDYGTVIKNNYIHDCTPNVDFEGGTIAVYLDDFMSGITVSGNIIENMQLGGQFSGYNNEWTNNIFINCEHYSIRTVFNANISAFSMQTQLVSEWKAATYRTNDAWKNAFPKLYAQTEENVTKDLVSTGNVVANNYMWNSPGVNIEPAMVSSKESIIKDNVSSNRDPGFYNAEDKIYLLKEDAEIFKSLPDFKVIPFTRIGRYDERAIKRVKDALTLVIDSPYVIKDGEKQLVNSEEPEQMPVIIDNSTYVPFRFLGEALGMEVEFDDETRIATFKNPAYTLEFSIDVLDKIKKNDEELMTDIPMKVINGRTYMPLRAISEMIDKEVFWDDCGFITVSDTENLFDSIYDRGLIDYLYEELNLY